MFGNNPARRLSSPPFEVESYLNQNIQAADWIAALIDGMWAYRLEPEEFADHEIFETYFAERIHRLAPHSSVMKRKVNRATVSSETTMMGAFPKTFRGNPRRRPSN